MRGIASSSAVGGVELCQRCRAGAKFGLAEPVERGFDGVQQLVQIVGIRLDKQEASNDLALLMAQLEIAHR